MRTPISRVRLATPASLRPPAELVEWARSQGAKIELTDDKGTVIPSVRTPIVLSGTPLRYERPSPRIGEHGNEILAELAELERKTQ